jgi:methylglutaconyl-CoA hydratase
MLTGRRFSGTEAENYKLVNKSLRKDEIDSYVEQIIDLLLSSGHEASARCKELIGTVVNNITLDEAKAYTANMIAQTRCSAEGQEGMAAFLEKRDPKWII